MGGELKRYAQPAGRAPDNTALPDCTIVQCELKVIGDRDWSGQNQARSGLGEITHGAVDADAERRDQDPGALEHPLSLCLSFVRLHAFNLQRACYTLANQTSAESLIQIRRNRRRCQ
jgi:hypothetical protein